jgi:hypothetical protein
VLKYNALIRTGQQFDWQRAIQAVLGRFAFRGDLDERDRQSLDPASGRYLQTGAMHLDGTLELSPAVDAFGPSRHAGQ